jgi:antitoxin CptB
MKNSNRQEKINHLRWQCRRGMLELDLLLLPFFDRHYAMLSTPQQALFERLLSQHDHELYQILIKRKPVSDSLLAGLIESIACGH